MSMQFSFTGKIVLMKSVQILIVFLLIIGPVFSQTNSLILNEGNPVWQDTKDQYMYPVDSYKEYFIQFDVNELAGVSKLWIELSLIPSEGKPVLISRRYYLADDLRQNYRTNSTIRVSFGNLEIGNYSVSVQSEQTGKRLGKKITKNNSQ